MIVSYKKEGEVKQNYNWSTKKNAVDVHKK